MGEASPVDCAGGDDKSRQTVCPYTGDANPDQEREIVLDGQSGITLRTEVVNNSINSQPNPRELTKS